MPIGEEIINVFNKIRALNDEDREILFSVPEEYKISLLKDMLALDDRFYVTIGKSTLSDYGIVFIISLSDHPSIHFNPSVIRLV